MRLLRNLLLTLSGALGAAGAARADAVTDWAGIVDRADEASTEESVAAIRAPSRAMLAMFEAANAVDRHYASFLGVPVAQAGSDPALAVASAARAVLAASYKAGVAEAASAYASALARVPEGHARTVSVAVGEDAARRAMDAGGLDPARPVEPYRPHTQPGVWVPTTPPSFPPVYQSLKPWFMVHADDLRPPPPPSLASPAYLAAFEETKTLGGLHSAVRTAAQTRQAQFWKRIDELALMAQVAARPGRSLAQNARLYALMALAGDDVGSALGDAKMHYGFWRPVTAIRDADQDPSPATVRDAGWEPLLTTPMHPEYVCGHCTNAALEAAILEAEPGLGPAARLHFVSRSLPGETEDVTLEESVSACSLSRIYGGVHFRFSNQAGEKLGRAVASLAVSRFAPTLAR